MVPLSLEVQREREHGFPLFPTGLRVRAVLRGEYSLPQTAEHVLRCFSEPLREQPIGNRRGRPRETLTVPTPLAEQEEELFFAAGDVIEHTAEGQFNVPFHFQLKTRFREFRGKEIIYDVTKDAAAPLYPLGDLLTPLLVTRLVPARLSTVRFGVELFRPRFLGALIGLVPTIDRRFYAEFLSKEIRFFFAEERPKTALPLESFITAISQVLNSLGLLPDFLEQIARRKE